MSLFKELEVPISHDSSLKDTDLSTLNKRGFVRAATAQAQWLLLVNDARESSKLPLNDIVRDYLVLLLDRFTTRNDIFDVIVGFSYFQEVLQADKVDERVIQDLADISMLHVALFPGRLTYRHYPTTVSKSMDIGVEMFQFLSDRSEGKEDWWTQAYKEVGQSYLRAVIVLKLAMPQLAFEEQKLRRIYGDVVRLPGNYEASVMKKQIERFEQMYLLDDLGEGH